MSSVDLQKIFEDPSTGDSGVSDNKLVITDVMRTAEDRIYMTINGRFDLQINKTDEGIVLDVFSVNPTDDADEVIASTYAYDSEVLTQEEWENENA